MELQAISGYLSRQRNVHDRPRLFAWLASRDFGTQLVHGRRHSAQRETGVDIQATGKRRCTPASANPPIDESMPTTGPSSAASSENQALWQSILTTMQRDVPPTEFATWLADTVLLDVDYHRQIVVVGTPNVFARDVIQQRYILTLSTELTAHLHQAYEIHVAVDGG